MIDAKLFASVFGVIFAAELPDKTALSALVLATRHRPAPVWLGAALALTVQSAVAISAGKLLSLLPPLVVHRGAGVLFLVSAVLLWRRKSEDAEPGPEGEGPTKPSFLRSFAATFGVVFLAEWGDLTQIGTATLVARYGQPLTVFCAATLALWSVTAIAVFVGNRAGRLLDPEVTKKVAAAIFLLLGVALVTGVA